MKKEPTNAGYHYIHLQEVGKYDIWTMLDKQDDRLVGYEVHKHNKFHKFTPNLDRAKELANN